MTDCKQKNFGFQGLGRRKVEADFSGGHLSSNSGVLLIGELDRRLGLSAAFARCFGDRRDQRLIEHSVLDLVRQRVYGLVAGYEDINDHERLKYDPLLATVVGKEDPLGKERCVRDQGKALAGKSTLNRLELGAQLETGLHKIHADADAIESFFVEAGVAAIPRKTKEIILDFDATDDLIHGMQEGRFYHGYYRNYCYLPLYCFCGNIPLLAKLRKSDIDPCQGTVEALERVVSAVRERFGEKVKIIVRADSGFCRDELMSWCEDNGVFYCIGLAKNKRLIKHLDKALFSARVTACLCGGHATQFDEFEYRTLTSWTRARRVIGKAQIMPKGENPRFIVTNLPGNAADHFAARRLYKEFYCARGEMENRIKEQQLDLFSDRTSTGWMASNQLRLWFSTLAHLLVELLRSHGLAGTRLAKATAGTIRQELLKCAAAVKISVRRVYIQMCTSFPLQQLWERAYLRIAALPARC
jgi:hypothetical protein